LPIPLAEERKIINTLIVLVSSDRGLIGPFNTLVFKAFERFMVKDKVKMIPEHKYLYLAIGKKSEAFLNKKNLKVVKSFYGFDDFIYPEQTEELSNYLIEGFKNLYWDRVLFISMHFRSALKQDPLVRQVLPVDFNKIKETIDELVPEKGKYSEFKSLLNKEFEYNNHIEYIFEPSAEFVLSSLIPHLIHTQIYHLILEANASEHSARMAAMKLASDNAQKVSQELVLNYNKVRQSVITKEVIEINATQSSLSS
jgi:F-type H+-transporting ATPase subunit gamma